MRRKPLENIVSALLLGAVLIVVANAWLAFHEEQILSETEYWVAHTWEVADGLEHLIGSVKDAETGERGFLITGNEHYLAPYNAAAATVGSQMDHLFALTSDNPAQTRRLAVIRQLAASRMQMLARAIEARRTRGEDAGFAVVRLGAGNEEMEQLRHEVSDAEHEEHQLLASRQIASVHARTQAKLSVALASTLDILLLLAGFWALDHERRLRQQAAENLNRLEKLQAINEVGLTELSVSSLIDELLARLLRIAEVDAVALFRCEGEGTTEEMECAEAIVASASAGFHLTPGKTMVTDEHPPLMEALKKRQLVRLDGEMVTRLGIAELPEAMGSVLILPMLVGQKALGQQRVTGALVASRVAAYSFNHEDEQLLSIVVDRIGVALDRAQLFEREHAARREAERLAAEAETLARAAEQSAMEVIHLNAELEERVQQRTLELETTNRELEAFSYSVSHDLRAPLRSVDGFSVALAEDFGALLTDEGKHYLTRIRAGVQRMGQLIDALLQLSRITRAELVIEQVDMSALALDVARMLGDQNLPREIIWVIEPGLTALGDPRLLRAVFENMMGNAVKFTAKVTPARIEFGWDPERAAYFIRDNGAGFDQTYAGKLFVAFQRLHGDKDFSGSGIGLASVARVIRRHHGTIEAHGVVGQGATFWFTLEAA